MFSVSSEADLLRDRRVGWFVACHRGHRIWLRLELPVKIVENERECRSVGMNVEVGGIVRCRQEGLPVRGLIEGVGEVDDRDIQTLICALRGMNSTRTQVSWLYCRKEEED